MTKKTLPPKKLFWMLIPLCLSLVLSMCSPAAEEPHPNVPVYENLSAKLRDFVSAYGLAGLGVGIVADGKIAYAEGFGYENALTLAPVTSTTVFHAASISKTFVATAVMQFVEQGLVNIDNPLTDYIPLFTMADNRYRSITIKQILTHTSGMPDVEDYEWQAAQYDESALENYVLGLRSAHMIGDPGAGWSYSNLAFDCLGNMIAKVSGISFEEYEARFVLRPSGMSASTFLKPADLPAGWASPHHPLLTPRVWTGYPYNRIHAPSSTLHTSVNELCNWAITNLNQGTFNGARILLASTYETLWGEHFPIPSGRGLFHSGGHQALAWAIGRYGSERIIGHSGSDEGFVSNLILVPGQSAAVVILCNIETPYLQELTGLVLDAALGRTLPQLHPPAAVAAFRTLTESGLEAAVARWNALKTDSPNSYDFSSTYPFYIGESVLERGSSQEAESFARLFARIMPAGDVADAISRLRAFLLENPGNTNAEIMLQALSAAGKSK